MNKLSSYRIEIAVVLFLAIMGVLFGLSFHGTAGQADASEAVQATDPAVETWFAAQLPRIRKEVEQQTQKFRFDKALNVIRAFEKLMHDLGDVGTALNSRVREEIASVRNEWSEHDRLLKEGFVVFEGRLIQRTKRDALLTERNMLWVAEMERANQKAEAAREANQEANNFKTPSREYHPACQTRF